MGLENCFTFNEEHEAIFELLPFIQLIRKKQKPWGREIPADMQKKISDAIKEKRFIPPLIFSDSNFSWCNTLDCTLEQHIERIAWLVKHWCDNKSEPIHVECDINGSIKVINGFHRLFALAFIDKKATITLRFKRGSRALIEETASFVEWASRTPRTNWFGQGVLSTTSTSYRFETANHRIAVKNSLGVTIARLITLPSRKKIEVVGEDLCERYQPNTEDFVRLLSEKVDPLFENVSVRKKLRNHLEMTRRGCYPD